MVEVVDWNDIKDEVTKLSNVLKLLNLPVNALLKYNST